MRPSLLALLLSSFIFFLHFFGLNTSHSPGETWPRRIEIAVGDSANITCRFNPEILPGKDSSLLYFVAKLEENAEEKISSNDIIIVNGTTIIYMLRNAPTQSRDYICKIENKAIDLTHVSVGEAPQDVVDFKCRAYDYTYMVCQFTTPNNTIATQYNLTYKATSPNYLQNCSLRIGPNNGQVCNLTLTEGNYRQNYDLYNFTLTGVNKLGVKQQHFNINHHENVILARPEMHLELINTHNATLTWQMNQYPYFRSQARGQLQYEIRLKPKDFDWIDYLNYTASNKRKRYKLTLRHLPYAYYEYTLSVRVRVMPAHNDDTWSEPFVHNFMTLACQPYAPPTTDVGSFYIDPSETSVQLYWQQLRAEQENGPNFHYAVTEIRIDGVVVHNFTAMNIDRSSAKFSWQPNHRYEFAIKSRNDEGDSIKSSRIIVPLLQTVAGDKSPKWISNIYHESNHTFTLSWIAPHKKSSLVDYTVYWCRSKLAKNDACEGNLHFRHISSNSTEFSLSEHMVDDQQRSPLNFAVSANYHGYNSGMHWLGCTAEVNTDLIKLKPEITATAKRTIQVQWSPDDMCISPIEGYRLTYCQVDVDERVLPTQANCVGERVTVNIGKTAKKHLIAELKPFTVYKVEMYMYSKLKSGKVSDAQLCMTKEEAPSPPRDLEYSNVTSNSVYLSWLPPMHLNGHLRSYTIFQNNESHTINCTAADVKSICTNEHDKRLSFKLENLSSFTFYKVYIIATTVEASRASNDIHVKTLIGIPSNPINIEMNETVLTWSRPEVPSGRVEFYEVEVAVWYKNHLVRQRISGVAGATSCRVKIPACEDMDYTHTLHVRAVNVAERGYEVDHSVFPINGSIDKNEQWSAMFHDGNDDLKCIGGIGTEVEQLELLQHYRNAHNFVQYRSVWEKGPTYNCANPIIHGYIFFIWGLVPLVACIFCIILVYNGRKKYNKMKNIRCELPPGLLQPTLKKELSSGRNISNNYDDKSKEAVRLHNESICLLTPGCNDSGYLDAAGVASGNFDARQLTPCSSSGYMGSDGLDENYSQNSVLPIQANLSQGDDLYMIMKSMKQSNNIEQKPKKMPANSVANIMTNNGYVQPNGLNIAMIKNSPITTPRLLPTSNGYVRPNSITNWQPPETENNKPYMEKQNGYVESQMFAMTKPAQQLSMDGYTTLDALRNPHMPSGYVTQQKLSEFRQRLS